MSVRNGKYHDIASTIAGVLIEKNIASLEKSDNLGSESNHKGIHITLQEIRDILSIHSNEINLYPSDIEVGCRPFAVFLCLQGKLGFKKKYQFSKMLEDFSLHMHGECKGKTKEAVIITNTWWPQEYDKYYYIMQNAKRNGLYLEVYFIGPPGLNFRPDDLILRLDI